MKFLILAAVFSLFLLSPAFAAGNLSVTSTSLAPVYINTRTVTNMLNLTMNSTVGNTNITSLNVTIAGNITIANVSGVFLINATGSTIASSTSNSTTTKFTVSIPAGFNASSGANTSLIIAVNVSGLANPSSNVSLQLESSAAFAVDSSSNVTFSNFVNSTDSEIRDLHANASVSPNFVDTNAINQTITYSVVMTGHEKLNGTIITIPSGYSFVNISNVELEGANNTAIETVTTSPNYINVTLSITKSKIKVFFNVNTSNSRINSSAFATAISGGNLNNVTTDTVSPGVNVTTQQLINVTNVALAKGAAIVNGTDYWEFNFTLGFTANVTGLLQFKMSDWTDASSSVNRLNINTSSVYYATLRNNTNNFTDANGKFNVTNSYVENTGLTRTITDSGTLTLILRMIIPLGTPISNSWASTYGFLFRPTS